MSEADILTQQEAFEFLEDLRDSGSVNMFLAPTEMVRWCNCSKEEAVNWFKLWKDSL